MLVHQMFCNCNPTINISRLWKRNHAPTQEIDFVSCQNLIWISWEFNPCITFSDVPKIIPDETAVKLLYSVAICWASNKYEEDLNI